MYCVLCCCACVFSLLFSVTACLAVVCSSLVWVKLRGSKLKEQWTSSTQSRQQEHRDPTWSTPAWVMAWNYVCNIPTSIACTKQVHILCLGLMRLAVTQVGVLRDPMAFIVLWSIPVRDPFHWASSCIMLYVTEIAHQRFQGLLNSSENTGSRLGLAELAELWPSELVKYDNRMLVPHSHGPFVVCPVLQAVLQRQHLM